MATILGDVQYTQVMGHLTTPDESRLSLDLFMEDFTTATNLS